MDIYGYIHGYIHGYCAVAFANLTEYLSVLSLYKIFLSVVLTL